MDRIDHKVWQVLQRLGEQADKERSGEISSPEGQRMLAITSDTGMYFNIMLKAIYARKVLEVGTSVGYSTLWFADAIKYIGSQGQSGIEKPIVTIENNPAKIARAQKNFEEAGVTDMIEIYQGTASDVLKEILSAHQGGRKQNSGSYSAVPFDFVFIDADKENAISYFDLIIPMVRSGGIIAADNITHPESCVAEMAKYSRYVKGRPDVESVTVPIGNGEEITIKLTD